MTAKSSRNRASFRAISMFLTAKMESEGSRFLPSLDPEAPACHMVENDSTTVRPCASTEVSPMRMASYFVPTPENLLREAAQGSNESEPPRSTVSPSPPHVVKNVKVEPAKNGLPEVAVKIHSASKGATSEIQIAWAEDDGFDDFSPCSSPSSEVTDHDLLHGCDSDEFHRIASSPLEAVDNLAESKGCSFHTKPDQWKQHSFNAADLNIFGLLASDFDRKSPLESCCISEIFARNC